MEGTGLQEECPGMADLGPKRKAPARACRRAQFQLWIFSYTILVGPSKNYVSRVLIDFTNDFSLNL